VKQYGKLLAMDGVNLQIEKSGLEAMAESAIDRGTGARALRSIFEKIMLDVMYEVPSNDHFSTVTINREVVEGETEPKVIEDKEDSPKKKGKKKKADEKEAA
jgi:ATP-dependent Clp protease ATP-binding subunit ClpX